MSVRTRANNISYHFPGASSSLSDIVMTDTAGDGVSCIVMVCCRPGTTCWDCLGEKKKKKMKQPIHSPCFKIADIYPSTNLFVIQKGFLKLTAEQTTLPLQSDQWCSAHSEVLNPVIKKILSILYLCTTSSVISVMNFFQWNSLMTFLKSPKNFWNGQTS